MTILENIIAQKHKEVEILKAKYPITVLERRIHFDRVCVSMSASLVDDQKYGIIAEFKRKSPSRGVINSSAEPGIVVPGYYRNGASGMSVLTDYEFFGGSETDLAEARQNGNYPLLRKDFMIDEYQVYEAKSIGADMILLIAAALNPRQLNKLAQLAHSLGMEVLMEIHNQEELEGLNDFIDVIGVNNRDLKTFKVDINTSLSISSKIPGKYLRISESGISTTEDIKMLKRYGFNGFLIGDRFMSSDDPVAAFSDFVKELD